MAWGFNAHAENDDSTKPAEIARVATFQGETIEHWVDQLRRGPVRELNKAGEKAMPVWLAAVKDPKAVAWVRHALIFEFKNQDWIGPVYAAMLDLPDRRHSQLAILDLERRPDIARLIAPALIKKASQWSQSDDVQQFRLVESLIGMLNNLESPPEETIEMVAEIWPRVDGETFLQRDLLELLGRSGARSVRTAFEIFLEYNPPLKEVEYYADYADKRTVIRIIAESQGKTPEHRRVAAAMISHLTDSDDPKLDPAVFVREIERLLGDSDLHVRRYALVGAQHLNGATAAEKLIVSLEQLLSDTDSESRNKAARALAAFGARAMPSIRKAVASKNADTRIVAGSAIRSMDPVPAEGLDLLLALAADEDPKVRNYAVFNLGETHSSDPRVSAALLRAFEDPATESWAARALGELGESSEDVTNALKTKLQSDDIRKRLQAASALWTVTKNAELVLPIARAVAKDDQGITSAAYSATYQTIDGKRVEQRTEYRYPLAARAAKLLGQMGAAAEPAVDELVAMLDHKNSRARSAAIEAIGAIGPAASRAVPALEKLLQENANRQISDTLKRIRATTSR